MTRDNIIGLLLIAFILIGYSLWIAPKQEDRRIPPDQVKDQYGITDTIEPDGLDRDPYQESKADPRTDDEYQEPLTDPDDIESVTMQRLRERMGYFSQAAAGEKKHYTIENDVIKLIISSQGGHVESVELKHYKTFEKQPLLLFSADEEQFSLNFFSNLRRVSTDNLFFAPYLNGHPYDGQAQIAQTGAEPLIFSMRAYTDLHSADRPSFIEFTYGLQPNEYMVDFDVNFTGTQVAVDANNPFINLDWRARLARLEKNRQNEQNNTTIYYKYTNDEVSRIRPTRDDRERLTTSIRWISFKQQFFSSVLISNDGFANADIESNSLPDHYEDYLKFMTASINMEYDSRSDNHYHLNWYFGPNSYQNLRAYDLELERQIPLGWGFFLMSWINRFAVIPIFNYLDGFDMNYGIIILILTILLKIVLLPIAYKTYVSQAKMRVLKPEIDELGKKFPKKEDAMKKQQATMALYKKAGVNPMAGCVPMLLQLPILLALFRFFPASIELRQQGFLWADDLSSYDSILDLPFTIPFYGDHVSLFTLLMAGSMVLYTHLNSQMMSSSNQMPGMKTMMYMMPVMLLGIFNSFASGLSYYYFLANVITFGQMFIFKKMIDEDALRAKIEENKKKPVKKSKWQQRMEQLAKQQEAQKKRKKK